MGEVIRKNLLLIMMFTCFSFCYGSEKLIVVAEELPPYVYAQNGKVVGIDVDIAKEIFKKLKVEAEFKIFPWNRCWNYIQKGSVDIALTVSKKTGREEFVYYPDNFVWESKFLFFTNKKTMEKYKIKGYDDVKKYKLKVGVISGNSYNEKFFEAFPFEDEQKKVYNKLLESSVNNEVNFKNLENNRVNLIPADLGIGETTVKFLKLKNITYYEQPLLRKPYFSVFSKKSGFKNDRFGSIDELVTAYDAELGKLKKTDRYKEIFDKYMK